MMLAFVLSMPNCASWNGKWSGEENKYVIVRTMRTEQQIELALKILHNPYYYYSFGDGWGASVSVTSVDSKQDAKLRKQSDGFCGYDWMVDSIVKHQEILSGS